MRPAFHDRSFAALLSAAGRLALSLALPLVAMAPPESLAYHDTPELRQFVHDMVEREGFSQEELGRVFANAEYQQGIVDAMERPAERTLEWKEYRQIFVTENRIKAGAVFWRTNSAALERAEARFGVPAGIVVAIIGVETMYGQRMGHYRVIDALTTLAFDYPPRGAFFRNELKEFLLLAREERQDVGALLGSYAGAMGYGQFIPSSYRSFAIDFDGDGVRDIWFNPVDAIGSVANYLSRHGWEAGEPITCPVDAPHAKIDPREGQALKPTRTVREWIADGFVPRSPLEEKLPAQPFLLIGETGPEYWLSLPNFYAITRYNHSELYAMAVYQLSGAIAGWRTGTLSTASDAVTLQRQPE